MGLVSSDVVSRRYADALSAVGPDRPPASEAAPGNGPRSPASPTGHSRASDGIASKTRTRRKVGATPFPDSGSAPVDQTPYGEGGASSTARSQPQPSGSGSVTASTTGSGSGVARGIAAALGGFGFGRFLGSVAAPSAGSSKGDVTDKGND